MKEWVGWRPSFSLSPRARTGVYSTFDFPVDAEEEKDEKNHARGPFYLSGMHCLSLGGEKGVLINHTHTVRGIMAYPPDQRGSREAVVAPLLLVVQQQEKGGGGKGILMDCLADA